MLGRCHSARTECSDRILFGHGHSAWAECSDTILLEQDSVRPRSLCVGRVFGHDSVRTEFCSAVVTLLGQSVRTRFCSDRILFGHGHSAWAECSDTILSDRILFGHGHSAWAECSDTILLWQDSVRPRSLCTRKVFRRDSVRTEFCSAVVTLLGHSVRTRFCSEEFCSAVVTLIGQSVQTRFCSDSILFGHGHSAPAECSDTILLGKEFCSDQADDKANPKPLYTADEKSGKMSTEDLQDLIREYPLPEGWYARLPGLQEPANYGTKFETVIYEEQVKSGYRLPLHPFALCFFEHYRMAPEQLVPNGWRKLAGLIFLVQTSGYKPDATDFMIVFFEICFVKGVANCPGWYYIHNTSLFDRLDKGELPFDIDWNPFCKDFKNPGKPTPNNLTKHILSHIKLRGGLCIDEPLSEEQLEWAKIIPPKPIPAGLQIPSPPLAIPSMSSAETVPRWLAEVENRPNEKAKGKRKEKQPSAELPPVPKRTRVTPPERSPRILEQVSIDDDPIFRLRWTLRCDDLGMPDSHVSEQHLLHGILPRDKEVFQTQTHETFACSFAQAVYTMYASGSDMLSPFEMARQVAADEAQQKKEAVKEAQEASHRAEELSKQEADHLAQIATLEKRLERVKRKAAEEVTKASDQGIRDFLDGNAGDEWLKKRTDDGLEIYELGFAKAKEMFVERFPDISLDDFVLPAVISPSGETVLPSETGDAAASHPPGEGPSGDAPEP
ncbi:hypothetical protein RJ639_030158 [Escallonia herrerae]|uniref:Transposase (putative) gypsy type domain-containing protein n=1 Tax=Escallonia herrerae TaxID=1293975 RepID=A0AA89BMX0_9ASTE|nr:hypothetical protein RJ639_030158 [Escallonia herrerae]